MTRGKRIALELLGPPLVGTTLVTLVFGGLAAWDIVGNQAAWRWDPHALAWIPFVLFFAYVVAGIPSILYAIVMEWRFARGLKPQSWRAVGLSALLGLLSGNAITATGGIFAAKFELLAFASTGGLGLAVGFILGLLIKFWSTPKVAVREVNSHD